MGLFGCVSASSGPNSSPELIITPIPYYSTEKARALGTFYQHNLERLIDDLNREGVTRKLQFTNNIATAGGIGFFTHSGTREPDERFLEIVLAVPDVLDSKAEMMEKIREMFTQYGFDLLSVLVSDEEIFEDERVDGYGIDLSWRSTAGEASGTDTLVERGVIYLPKKESAEFVRSEIDEKKLLESAVIYAIKGNNPAKQIQ